MILMIFYLACLLFSSCLPHGSGTLPPICPKNFSCANVGRFEYPFYDTNDTRCGLVKVKCSKNGGEVQPGDGQSYEILSKYSSYPVIHNKTFQKLVENRSCEALTNNFNSPEPLLFSFIIQPFITLFKCTNDPKYAAQMEGYFDDYSRYGRCKYHNLYYKYLVSSEDIPAGLPQRCEVIKLPVRLMDERISLNETDIFSLLSSNLSLGISASSICYECHKKEGYCQIHYGKVQCLNAKEACSVVIVMILVVILCLKRKVAWRGTTKRNVNVETFLKNHEILGPKRYSYSQVKKMTNSFRVKLGQGGYGCVYKGTLINGNLVAVKVLNESKSNGEDFINEVASVGGTSHKNIISLLGFCVEGNQRALIYEFMPNGSLERFIYDRASLSKPQLGWEKLYQIAFGIAQGLDYLHRGCNTRILHFDIKPHNILLDKDFCPKISDFGLAKLLLGKRSMISMSITRGTPGYIAPELFSRNFGNISHKSDVYSYGMMILEMAAGGKMSETGVDHTSEVYFPHWIYKKVELNEELGLHGIISDEENKIARKLIIIGLWCIQCNPLSRPSIAKVLSMLEEDLELLEIPPKPYLSSPLRPVDSFTIDELQSI